MHRGSNKYALVIGVAQYSDDKIHSLGKSVSNDAKEVYDILTRQGYGNYAKSDSYLLIDPTSVEINIGLQRLEDLASSQDTVLIYFSGHAGQQNPNKNYLLASDSIKDDLQSTAISEDQLLKSLRRINSKQTILIFDCCHAAGFASHPLAKGESDPIDTSFNLDASFYHRLRKDRGTVILASSRANQQSFVEEQFELSYFTRALLEVLRGETSIGKDGLVRVFDLFVYLSEVIPHRRPDQTPVFAAQLESNMILSHLPNNKSPQFEISFDGNLSITTYEREIFQNLYTDSASPVRLVVKSSLGGGFSGGRVWIVQTINRVNGREEPNLPEVIKTGPADLIKMEWEAFSSLEVSKRAVNVVKITPPFGTSHDGRWMGLRYLVAGGGVFSIQPLEDFLKTQNNHSRLIKSTIDRLFKSLSPMWSSREIVIQRKLGKSYDSILPVNLRLRESDLSPAQRITPEARWHELDHIQVGTIIEIDGWEISEIDITKETITLDPPDYLDQEGWPNRCRIRVEKPNDLSIYRVGQRLQQPLVGQVILSRHQSLITQRQKAWPNFRTNHNQQIEITIAGQLWELPDPIEQLTLQLDRHFNFSVGPIHGDLNLNNVLVETDGSTLYLIDFANARRDAIFHDFHKLETEIWVKLVPNQLQEAKLGIEGALLLMASLTNQTLQVPPALEKTRSLLIQIRSLSEHYQSDNPIEINQSAYGIGLAIYLLGSLKFSNLDKSNISPNPKQVAYIAAAGILAGNQILDQFSLSAARSKPQINQDGKSSSSKQGASKSSEEREKKINKYLRKNSAKLIRLLTKCDQFQNSAKLSLFFSRSYKLSSFGDRLPRGESPRDLANAAVGYFVNRRHKYFNPGNVLFLMLCEIMEDSNDEDYIYEELRIFISDSGITCQEIEDYSD